MVFVDRSTSKGMDGSTEGIGIASTVSGCGVVAFAGFDISVRVTELSVETLWIGSELFEQAMSIERILNSSMIFSFEYLNLRRHYSGLHLFCWSQLENGSSEWFDR